MATKLLEVVVCDLCSTDRPAVAHREVDVCNRHDQQIAVHTEGAVVIACKHCGLTFGTKAGLREHTKKEHPETLEATFKCVKCGRMFLSNSGLGAHRLRKHGIAGGKKAS